MGNTIIVVSVINETPSPTEKPSLPYSTFHEDACPFSLHETLIDFELISVVTFETIRQSSSWLISNSNPEYNIPGPM